MLLVGKTMDFTNILAAYNCKACVISIDAYEDGTYGNILVADGNKLFKDDIEALTHKPFVNDSPYFMSFPKDMNFEDFIYRSAIEKRQLHTYVNLYQMGLWVEMYLLPLASDKEGTGYCLYSYNISPKVDEDNMTDISPETGSRVLSACIKFRSGEDFMKAVQDVAEDTRVICDASRCCILTIDNDNEICDTIGDAYPEGDPVFLTDEQMKKDFYKLVSTWEDTLAGSTCLIVKNEQEMQVIKERNPKWYESLEKYNVKSMVIFPLKYKGQLLGYIWATNFDVKNTVKIKETLELTTFFIGSEIANYNMLTRLEILSTIDLLTGSLNRNAMNNRVIELSEHKDKSIKSMGVLFADLNGLKFINDNDGHLEGDRALKQAAAVLRQIFMDDEIYRAGGDEFMILILNNTKEEYDKKLKKLQEIISGYDKPLFALGSCFEEGDTDIRRALRKADENMYEDKNKYYDTYPELRYR